MLNLLLWKDRKDKFLLPVRATEVSINKPGLAEELRPLTFISIDSSHYLDS